MREITVAYEGMGIWGRGVIEPILNRAGFKGSWHNHIHPVDLIVVGPFAHCQNATTIPREHDIPTILWSGEAYPAVNTFNSDVLFSIGPFDWRENKKHYSIPFGFIIDPQKPREYREPWERIHDVACCTGGTEPHRLDAIQKLKADNLAGKAAGDFLEIHHAYSIYRFALVMERFLKPGYVTEKIWTAFRAGCIPIYIGDESVKRLVNPDAFIYAEDADVASYKMQSVISEERIFKSMAEADLWPDGLPGELTGDSERHQQMADLLRSVI